MRRGFGGHFEWRQRQGPKRFIGSYGMLCKCFKCLPFVAAELAIEYYDARTFFGALEQAPVY